ncbi:MAG: aminotransferase class V-fold PLP-dependent enzyme [Candidatus Margulisiibacteriota bacterium]|jgi:aspartate aminotransferase-like enzyme
MNLLELVKIKQNEKVKRLTVGPVPIHPGMLEILGKQHFSTRDAVFVEIMIALQVFLQESVGTKKNTVVMEHGSGSAGLCVIGNHLLKPSDKVLVLNSGKFGERWVKVARKRGCQVIDLELPWDKKIDWNYVGESLSLEKPTVLLMQHSETSTGSVHSLALARETVTKNSPATLLVVDAISSWGSIPVNMDQNEIDAVVGASQKGFMLPTGLHFLCFSEKALKVIEDNKTQKIVSDFSHDPLADIKAQLKGEPRFSMDSNSLMALVYLKEEVIDKFGGWQKWFDFTAERAAKIRSAVQSLGLEIFSESAGDVVSAIKLSEKYEVKEIRKKLAAAGFEVNKSQDETKFRGIRIGNMGYITIEDVANLITALKAIFS